MQIALSTLAFTGDKLAEAMAGVRRLGFHSVDVAVFDWAHPDFTPAVIERDPQGAARYLLDVAGGLGLTIVAFNATAPPSGAGAATLAALCDCAAVAGVPVVTLPAGCPGDAGADRLAEAAQRLAAWTGIAGRKGVTLAIETHVGQVTERADAALRLVQEVPDLRLTLDPSHFHVGPWQGKDFTPLFPHTAHVHLRDARNTWETVQVPPGSGSVRFRELFTGLLAAGYAGALSIEYLRSLAGRDVAEDVRAMRELFFRF